MKKIVRSVINNIEFLFSCLYYRILRYFSNELIIYVNFGGLGDHLFYSPIPRLIKEMGYFQKVYISLDSNIRSDEIKEIVWKSNPYVDGFKFGKAPYYKGSVKMKEKKLLDIIAYMYGINSRYLEPEIYYKPKVKEELKGLKLYDPNYISNCGKITEELIVEYFRKNNILIDYKMNLRNSSLDLISCNKILKSESLYDFIDILSSVDMVFCLTTGTATLCAAINKRAHVLYGEGVTLQHHHSFRNTYIHLK